MIVDPISKFRAALKDSHYSTAFVQHLVDSIDDSDNITTFQEIYELIQKQSDVIINYFSSADADLKLIQYRNPLCFESLKEYFHRMMRGVNKKYGNDLKKFKVSLKNTSKELIEILSTSASKIVKNSELILKDNRQKKMLVYSYSKSIALSLKKLVKSLQDNLLVYVCKSGGLEQGFRMYQDLILEGIKCKYIGDNEIGYYISEVDCVLVGAEVILDNGGILNRAGTYQVCLLAHQAARPVYVFAESYKFIRKNYLCQKDIPQTIRQDRVRMLENISIDLTPPKYITMFCMDNGIFTPEVVSFELTKIFI